MLFEVREWVIEAKCDAMCPLLAVQEMVPSVRKITLLLIASRLPHEPPANYKRADGESA